MKRLRIGKGRLGIYLLAIVVLGIGYYVSRYLGVSVSAPHSSPPPVVIDKVYTRPVRITPDSDLWRFRGLVVELEGKVKDVGRSRRGNTFFLHLPPVTVVIFPQIAQALEIEPWRLGGIRIRAKGVLRHHERYGWEIILRDPHALVVAPQLLVTSSPLPW